MFHQNWDDSGHFAPAYALNVPPEADLRTLVDAMKGHVLADGELVDVFAAPTRQ